MVMVHGRSRLSDDNCDHHRSSVNLHSKVTMAPHALFHLRQ